MDPVVIWPAAVSVYLGGLVVGARQMYARKWSGAGNAPVSKGEALALGMFWPIWAPLMYLGKTVRALWRLAVRLTLGDL
jgi:hypothetical protein